jgi:hypothetical protein
MSNDRYQKIRDALAGVAERESLRQRAAAWDAVADTLGEVCPEWINHPGTGTEAAVAAIRKLAQQPAAVDGLAARLVDELDGLVSESDGVSGLHLNGDVATWEELLPGGRFERLSSLDELREALAAAQQQQPAVVFRNDGNTEADFIAHEANACTACGGSGHKADQQPADKARAAAYRDCCDTPAYCSSVRRCTAKDGKQPNAKAYAGCTIWRGSLRVSVTETEAIEHCIDADEAFCDLVQRALDSLAAAWDAAALATQHQGDK